MQVLNRFPIYDSPMLLCIISHAALQVVCFYYLILIYLWESIAYSELLSN